MNFTKLQEVIIEKAISIARKESRLQRKEPISYRSSTAIKQTHEPGSALTTSKEFLIETILYESGDSAIRDFLKAPQIEALEPKRKELKEKDYIELNMIFSQLPKVGHAIMMALVDEVRLHFDRYKDLVKKSPHEAVEAVHKNVAQLLGKSGVNLRQRKKEALRGIYIPLSRFFNR